ncbi:MAG: hypothetical protein IKP61_09625 [Spirochaetales bacterium]|nr:hypothetical protein [Spirochaetales bacterium]
MKKAVLILILSLLSSLLFGSEIYNSGTSNGGNDVFRVYGFYKPNEIEKVISLTIYALSTNNVKVQNTGLIDWILPQSGYKRAFSWKATGNFSGNMTIRFTITPLQAELDGYYFIPAHSYQAKLLTNGTNLSIVADLTDFDSSTGIIEIPNKSHSSIRSNEAYRLAYSGSKTGSTNSPWTENGLLDIKINDYNALYGGTFDYYSTVTVELTVDIASQGGN